VDEPQYDGFIGGIYGRFVFTISYEPLYKTHSHHFSLSIVAQGEQREFSYHETPHAAMKSAHEYMEGRQWEGDPSA